MCSKVEKDKIIKGQGSGQLSVSCALEDVQLVAQSHGSTVIVHVAGKTDVLRTTIQSPDGQEISYFDDVNYRLVSQESNDKIDWEAYNARRM